MFCSRMVFVCLDVDVEMEPKQNRTDKQTKEAADVRQAPSSPSLKALICPFASSADEQMRYKSPQTALT